LHCKDQMPLCKDQTNQHCNLWTFGICRMSWFHQIDAFRWIGAWLHQRRRCHRLSQLKNPLHSFSKHRYYTDAIGIECWCARSSDVGIDEHRIE
jgi:hypothetical protein